MSFFFLIPVAIMLVILYFSFRPLLRMRNVSRQLQQSGTPELGTVVDIGQTGLSINGVQQLQIDVDLHAAGTATRRVGHQAASSSRPDSFSR